MWTVRMPSSLSSLSAGDAESAGFCPRRAASGACPRQPEKSWASEDGEARACEASTPIFITFMLLSDNSHCAPRKLLLPLVMACKLKGISAEIAKDYNEVPRPARSNSSRNGEIIYEKDYFRLCENPVLLPVILKMGCEINYILGT